MKTQCPKCASISPCMHNQPPCWEPGRRQQRSGCLGWRGLMRCSPTSLAFWTPAPTPSWHQTSRRRSCMTNRSAAAGFLPDRGSVRSLQAGMSAAADAPPVTFTCRIGLPPPTLLALPTPSLHVCPGQWAQAEQQLGGPLRAAEPRLPSTGRPGTAGVPCTGSTGTASMSATLFPGVNFHLHASALHPSLHGPFRSSGALSTEPSMRWRMARHVLGSPDPLHWAVRCCHSKACCPREPHALRTGVKLSNMNICRLPAGALSDLPAGLLFLQALCRCLLWYWSAATQPTPVTSRQAYQGG